MCQCDQRFRAENQAPISKNIGRRFKNAGGATDRFQKSDNVEIDDSAKIAGREIGPAQPLDRNESSMRAMRMSKIGVSARCSCIFPAAIVFSECPRCRAPALTVAEPRRCIGAIGIFCPLLGKRFHLRY